MTKGQAISYAQITLNFIKNPDNNVKLTLKNFRKEMQDAFKLYPANSAKMLAKNMEETEEEFNAGRRKAQ